MDQEPVRTKEMKLAIVASHPIQYMSPFYRALSARLEIHVFYAHRPSGADQAAAGFGIPFEWDIPLLEGYPFTWLENHAQRPGLRHFWSCNTPGVGEEIQKGGFDAVLVSGWNLLCYWQAVLAARRAKIPVLVRGDSHLLTPRGRWKRAAKEIAFPYLLNKFSAFLSVGRRNAEYLRGYGVPKERIFFAPHCVDNEFFRQRSSAARRDPDALRRRFGIPPGKTVFIFGGRWIPQKRPLDFLRALDLAAGQRDLWGVLAGEGPLRPLLERHVHRHGTPCSMVGFLNQQEISPAYAAAHVLVLPSDGRESWGLVVNEAMACGVPAIVSDQVGCAPDLVLEGKTGFTFPLGGVAELAQRMESLAENPRLREGMAADAADHIRDFSLEKACDGLEEALGFVMRKERKE